MSFAFKIVKRNIWDLQMKKMSKFIGTADDLKDGFIHLSTKEQVHGTILKKFQNDQESHMVVCVDLDKIQGCVKWEASRGKLYPHVYGSIVPRSVSWTKDLPLFMVGDICPFPTMKKKMPIITRHNLK